MTGATGFALVHLFHHPAFDTAARADNRIVAIVATVTFLLMHLMAEINIAGTCLQFVTNGLGISRMAFLAVGFNPKDSAVVVTGPTGLSLLHLGHCAGLVGRVRDKQRRMTILAAVCCYMNRMAE